ncbi:hypothetical protein ABF176_002383 [Flavobacterium psychrophilum]|uniref:hypothetical protein n=1 Tax=Flavobacterium psychrophilum TaxID=96345 RepID=UPI00115405D5|nr:hypothetical protein [Flavobacterium psychrophilum]GEJ30893.1 hypothetical protein FPN184_contig00006-0004 [Flavobacterium psychrophilum]GEJ50403.1 hypothetical protein FPKKA176_contig00098-0004 [Flavobacterium psychrophilum]
MYPTVKFVIDTKLDFNDSVSSLFNHYSKHYLDKLVTDRPNFDNLSQGQVDRGREFSNYIKDCFTLDLQTCIAQEHGLLNDDNREEYLKPYFEYSKKFRNLLESIAI